MTMYSGLRCPVLGTDLLDRFVSIADTNLLCTGSFMTELRFVFRSVPIKCVQACTSIISPSCRPELYGHGVTSVKKLALDGCSNAVAVKSPD